MPSRIICGFSEGQMQIWNAFSLSLAGGLSCRGLLQQQLACGFWLINLAVPGFCWSWTAWTGKHDISLIFWQMLQDFMVMFSRPPFASLILHGQFIGVKDSHILNIGQSYWIQKQDVFGSKNTVSPRVSLWSVLNLGSGIGPSNPCGWWTSQSSIPDGLIENSLMFQP